MNNPRKHHYCPQFYLKNFSEPKTDKFWVFDKDKKEFRSSKPINEAHQRDFYRIEVKEGEDPFVIEKEFGKIEDKASEAVEYIIKNNKLPDIELLEYLISFVALLAVRTPWFKKTWNNFTEKVFKKVMELTFADEKRWEVTRKRMIMQGYDIPEDVTYEQMVDFVARDEYSIQNHQNEHIKLLLHSATILTDVLYKRNWALIINKTDVDWVCGDRPVVLKWMEDKGQIHSPGFGIGGTELIVALSPKIALVSTFEKLETIYELHNKEAVATYNTYVFYGATRFIYSRYKNLTILDDSNKLEFIQEDICKLQGR